MARTRIQKGDRVKVVLDNVRVTRVEDSASGQRVYLAGTSIYQPGEAHVFTGGTDVKIKVTRPVEPQWQVDDVVLDSDGGVYKRWTGDRWVEFYCDDLYPDLVPRRPLKLITRGGRAVS